MIVLYSISDDYNLHARAGLPFSKIDFSMYDTTLQNTVNLQYVKYTRQKTPTPKYLILVGSAARKCI